MDGWKILKREGIHFQTPLNKMCIHWTSRVKTYVSAEDAANDLHERGYDVEDTGANTGETTLTERLQSTGIAIWKHAGRDCTGKASRRA